jgi:hypothetical protein
MLDDVPVAWIVVPALPDVVAAILIALPCVLPERTTFSKVAIVYSYPNTWLAKMF